MKFVSKYRKLKIGIDGEMIEFNNFDYETTKKKEIAAIQGSKLYGVAIFQGVEQSDNGESEEQQSEAWYFPRFVLYGGEL